MKGVPSSSQSKLGFFFLLIFVFFLGFVFSPIESLEDEEEFVICTATVPLLDEAPFDSFSSSWGG